MSYVLVVIMLVAMGGPKSTTPTIDHIPFGSAQACASAKEWIAAELKGKVAHLSLSCVPQG